MCRPLQNDGIRSRESKNCESLTEHSACNRESRRVKSEQRTKNQRHTERRYALLSTHIQQQNAIKYAATDEQNIKSVLCIPTANRIQKIIFLLGI